MPSPFATAPYPINGGAMSPFPISVPDEEVQKLKTLLELCPIATPNWENGEVHAGSFGVTRDWLVKAKSRWESWDWRQHEAVMNSVPHFKISITDDYNAEGDGQTYTIHFAGLFSQKKDAAPILFLHGWPGSFVEFLPMLLKVQAEYADKAAELPYHIIVPSLTGYGFSSPPPKDRDFTHVDQARLMVKMMSALGFGRGGLGGLGGFLVQGGDVGTAVASAMAAEYEEVKALHLNVLIMKPPQNVDPATVEYSARELESIEKFNKFKISGSDYGRLHGNRPSTIGLVVGSSPIALLAWIGEKMLAWSDPATQPSLDHILMNVSVYWFSRCYPTSIWYYRNVVDPSRSRATIDDVKGKPVGFSVFLKDIFPPPKAWRDASGKFTWEREHEKGGHFPALEQPDELWQDVVDFAKEAMREN